MADTVEESNILKLLDEFEGNLNNIEPHIQTILDKSQSGSISPREYVQLAEVAHRFWIFSEILSGRTGFLLEDPNKSDQEEGSALSVKEMIDVYSRKIEEAKRRVETTEKND